MILATVGTEPYPFNRLITWLEALINRGFLQEEVVVQYGCCTHMPLVLRSCESTTEACLQELGGRSRTIISHCDEEALLLLDRTAKPYILVPRAKSYKEHIDDRQIELAATLAQMGVPVAWSPGDLARFLVSPRQIALSKISALADRPLRQRLINRSG